MAKKTLCMLYIMLCTPTDISAASSESSTSNKPEATIDSSLVVENFLKNHPKYSNYAEILTYVAANPEDILPTLLALPEYALNGGISYAMTFDRMKETIKNIFITLKTLGKIITPEQFAKIKDEYYLGERRNFNIYAGHDLKRIWGADYIKNYQHYQADFNAPFSIPWISPDYVLVVEDPNTLTLQLDFDPSITKNGARLRDYPSWLGQPPDAHRPYIDSINGTIYFKKIIGIPYAHAYSEDYERWKRGIDDEFTAAFNLGYSDLSYQSDASNILKTDKLEYIVDTELGSFNLYRTFDWPHRRITDKEGLAAVEKLLKLLFLENNPTLSIESDGTLHITLDIANPE